MAAVAHSPAFAKKVGIQPSVGRDFIAADKRSGKYAEGGEVSVWPLDQRTYLQTLFGNRDPITARNFSPRELEAIRAAVQANQARTGATTRGNVGYADYPPAAEAGPGYVPVETTLGRFNYRVMPDGSLRVLDRYDFLNDERKANVERYEAMSPARRAVTAPLSALGRLIRLDPRGAAGELGDAFIGREGREVDIRVPPPQRKARGGLAQMKECGCGR